MAEIKEVSSSGLALHGLRLGFDESLSEGEILAAINEIGGRGGSSSSSSSAEGNLNGNEFDASLANPTGKSKRHSVLSGTIKEVNSSADTQ